MAERIEDLYALAFVLLSAAELPPHSKTAVEAVLSDVGATCTVPSTDSFGLRLHVLTLLSHTQQWSRAHTLATELIGCVEPTSTVSAKQLLGQLGDSDSDAEEEQGGSPSTAAAPAAEVTAAEGKPNPPVRAADKVSMLSSDARANIHAGLLAVLGRASFAQGDSIVAEGHLRQALDVMEYTLQAEPAPLIQRTADQAQQHINGYPIRSVNASAWTLEPTEADAALAQPLVLPTLMPSSESRSMGGGPLTADVTHPPQAMTVLMNASALRAALLQLGRKKEAFATFSRIAEVVMPGMAGELTSDSMLQALKTTYLTQAGLFRQTDSASPEGMQS